MIEVREALANVLHQLQGDPARYKLFGIWWWPVKQLLKRAGYDKNHLYLLGSYQDETVAELVPRLDLQGTMREALEEYNFNAKFARSGGRVETPDGEIVVLFDEDAGI